MKIKRTLVTILIFALLMQTVCVAFGENIESHWSYEATSYLSANGIISGDESGNFNLENNITRAEYVKIINRSFGYYVTAASNFKDVDEDAWYYNEFLIAKKMEYIKGDDNGNANPDSAITRNEAAVILGRILKLAEITDVNYFTDANIPDWAIGYANALKNEGLISGYEDGSFKGDASIKRAEAFQMIYNTIKPSGSSEGTDSTNTETFTGGLSNGGSGGSGGNGGNGGNNGNNSTKLSAPTIVDFNDTNESETITLRGVSNATKYVITVEGVNTSNELEVTNLSTSIDIKDLVREATEQSDDATVPYTVKVVAKADGYTDSAVIEQSGNRIYNSIPKPELKIETLTAWGVKRAAITWADVDTNDNSDFYSVSVNGQVITDSNGALLPTAPAGITIYQSDCKIVLDDSKLTEDIIISVKAQTKDKTVIKNSDPDEISYSISKTETIDNKEYVHVYSLSEFNDALTNNKNIILEVDLTLGTDSTVMGWTPVADYSGEIDGNGKTVTIYGNGGIIAVSSNLYVHDLTIKGIITNTSATNIGSVVGTVKYSDQLQKCVIENVINYASITAKSESGGIAGAVIQPYSSNKPVALDNSNYVIKNCINYGTIVGSGESIGGIVGHTRAAIVNCANMGSVTGGKYTGGIVGRINTTAKEISYSYNAGAVNGSTDKFTGGIAGAKTGANTNNMTIKYCYNAGSINQASSYTSYTAGGIIGSVLEANVPALSVVNCYNVGDVTQPIICNIEAGGLATCSNCYYLTGGDDGIGGTSSFADSGDIDSMLAEVNTGLTTSVFEKLTSSQTGYSYPEIIGNSNLGYKAQVAIADIEYDEAISGYTFNWTVSDSAYISGIELTIKDETEIKDVLTTTLLSTATSYVFNAPSIDKTHCYELQLKVNYVNGTSDTFTRESTKAVLPTPALSVVTMMSADGETQNALITWQDVDLTQDETYVLSIVDDNGEQYIDESNGESLISGLSVDYTNKMIKIVGEDLPSALITGPFKISIYAKSADSDVIGDSGISNVLSYNTSYEKKSVDDDGYYLVYTGAEFKAALEAAATSTTAYNIRLANDITLGAATIDADGTVNVTTSWTPMTYKWNFDGAGHTITVYFDDSNTEYVGVFSKITRGGSTPTTHQNVTIKGYISAKKYVGGYVGYLDHSTNIKNMTNYATIISAGGYAGGIVGYSTGNNYSANKICTIENCYNYADISSSASYCGGIVGNASMTNIDNSANFGAITCTANDNTSRTGGIAGGYTSSKNGSETGPTEFSIKNSYNTGDIKGNRSGGITGEARGTQVVNIISCYNTGSLYNGAGDTKTGGIVGATTNTSTVNVKYCYNAGEFDVSKAIIGYIDGSSGTLTVSDCYYLSETSEDDGLNDTTPKTAAELKAIASSLGAAFTAADATKSRYLYPEIKGNLNREGYECTIGSFASAFESDTLSFSWDISDADQIASKKVSIYNLTDVSIEANGADMTIADDKLSYEFDADEGDIYLIKVTITYKNEETLELEKQVTAEAE